MNLPVTVCIPVKNEEVNLPRCLDAIGDVFEEVVVVDSSSEDRTAEIVKKSQASYINFVWDGSFPKKRNWFLRNYDIKTGWVLFLDADEIISKGFIDELRKVIVKDEVVGCWLNYQNWFLDKELKYGDPFRKLAFFKRGAGEYEQFPEGSWSHLDMEVHEHPVLVGEVGEISHLIEHKDFRGMEHYIAKHSAYSDWEAERFVWLQKASYPEWSRLNERQAFKYKNLDKWWLAPVYFFVSYVIKLGVLDGSVGLKFAVRKFRYFTDIRMKIKDRRISE